MCEKNGYGKVYIEVADNKPNARDLYFKVGFKLESINRDAELLEKGIPGFMRLFMEI